MKPEATAVPPFGHGDDRVRILLLAFPNADPTSIAELASICYCLSIPGACPIVLEGEPSDAVYVVVTGMFAAYKQAADGREVLLNRLTSGATIGEIGFVTGAARTATVRALRNSEVLRISRDDLLHVASRHPEVMLAICATVVQRLQNTQAEGEGPAQPRTLCLLPGDELIDADRAMREMARNFNSFGTVTTVTANRASGRTSGWFAELERAFDYVLFLADCAGTAWSKFCLGQADCIVLLVRGNASYADLQPLPFDRDQMPDGIPLYMILFWQDVIVPGLVMPWLRGVKPKGHFHVRHDKDLARAARLIAGRGVGLVLSGGGARGLAHVGVLNALVQNGVPVDVIGGTSIGGIVAGLYAFELDLEATARSLMAAFSRRWISDFAVPRTALFSERSFTRTFGWLGDTRMEDAPIPLFCVSTNLTEGVPAVHQTGRLQTWLRATAAIPGIFPPVFENGAIHVDGGVLNNIPVDIVRTFGVSSVIAVDVGPIGQGARSEGSSNTDSVSLMELLWRVGTIGDGAGANAGRRDADLVLRPEVANVSLFGWRACDEAIAAGRQVVRQHIQDIRALLAGESRNKKA